GVETSEVPPVVADQLGLAKGFGLVVDYVVPDGPAAVAGVQANDILKMFNDQILTEPDQLAKLVRSSADAATVSLTVLRKGAETKLTAKLAKRDVPQRSLPGMGHGRHGDNFGFLGRDMQKMGGKLREQLGNMQFGMIGDAMGNAREEVDRARDEVRRAVEEGKRAAEEGRRAAREVRVVSKDNGAMKTTRIDLGKAQILYSDAQGEMKIETVDNKKVLTAKDPQGRLLFSGPITSKEELEKVPAEVRQRYEKLEQKDLPAVGASSHVEVNDADDSDDNDADDDAGGAGADALQMTDRSSRSFPFRGIGVAEILI
ncbi:MAG: PDZ domain-containing protein, partial [Verrucomicrobiota bacterium]|nr:PDZ domain-containing protein [Verrucomicrobiota bacterium]